MKDNRRFAAAALVLLAVFLMLGSLLTMEEKAQAGPLLIPTPVAEVAGGGDWVMVTYSDSDFTNAYDTVTSDSQHAPAYTAADVSWTIDVSGTITVTCTLEFSNDDSNWADGINILSSVTADETNMDQFNLFGRYHRISCTETGGAENENTVTYTIKAKLIN
jgi:hypothetical protein